MKQKWCCVVLFLGVLLSGCNVLSKSASDTRVGIESAEVGPPTVAGKINRTIAPYPSSAPSIYASSAILIDARTGRTLYEKNADAARPVASTQKLLTGLIVAERQPLNGFVTVQRSDTFVEPTKLGIKAGERYTRFQLLEAMLVKSCNDAAAALGRDCAGSEPAFALEMNRVAQSLGATNSYFANANGLPADQHSTARDMARIAFQAYRNPTLRTIMMMQSVPFRYNSGRVAQLRATNRLLGRSSIYNGMKTGFTNASGRCLVTSAKVGGHEFILVQLGSKTSYIFNDAERMIAWASKTSPSRFVATDGNGR